MLKQRLCPLYEEELRAEKCSKYGEENYEGIWKEKMHFCVISIWKRL